MTDWFDRIGRLVALSERVGGLTDRVTRLAEKTDNINTRLVRVETIIEIARPDGAVLRIAGPSDPAPDGKPTGD